jgi:hypothetical protein
VLIPYQCQLSNSAPLTAPADPGACSGCAHDLSAAHASPLCPCWYNSAVLGCSANHAMFRRPLGVEPHPCKTGLPVSLFPVELLGCCFVPSLADPRNHAHGDSAHERRVALIKVKPQIRSCRDASIGPKEFMVSGSLEGSMNAQINRSRLTPLAGPWAICHVGSSASRRSVVASVTVI